MPRLLKWALALGVAFGLLSVPVKAADPGVIYSHPTGAEPPRVALTFDDGPHPRYTPEILDILAQYEVPATFFTVGVNAETYPELILREVSEGHEIGNHTYNHYHVAKLSAQALRRDVLACTASLEKIIGRGVTLFRPPEGVCTDAIKSICNEQELSIVLWSIDTRDWAHTPVREICKNVKKNVKDGAIILMHDFTGKNSPTPEALRQIIPMLQELGYEFVTVSQLLRGAQ